MSIARSARSRAQQQAVEDAILAYAAWRDACSAVQAAYRGWCHAPGHDMGLAHRAYLAALEREEAAADHYAALHGVRRPPRRPRQGLS